MLIQYKRSIKNKQKQKKRYKCFTAGGNGVYYSFKLDVTRPLLKGSGDF